MKDKNTLKKMGNISINQKLVKTIDQYCHSRNVTKLLEAGADPNYCDERGFTVLMYWHKENVRILDYEGSFKNSHLKKLRTLEKYGLIKPSQTTGQLIEAVKQNNYSGVELAIQNGADTTHKYVFGFTPLMYACKYNVDAKIIELLLKSGATKTINTVCWNNLNALMWACVGEPLSLEGMQLLLDAGAGITHTFTQTVKKHPGTPTTPPRYKTYTLTNSAFTLACVFDAPIEHIKLFINHGADSNSYCYLMDIGIPERCKTECLYKDKYCIACEIRNYKTTPLIAGCTYSTSAEKIEFLLKNGADVNAVSACNDNFLTPLMLAAIHNKNIKILELLIKYGADINYRYECFRGSYSALELMLVYDRPPEFIQLLLDHGAKITEKRTGTHTHETISYCFGYTGYRFDYETITDFKHSIANAEQLILTGKNIEIPEWILEEAKDKYAPQEIIDFLKHEIPLKVKN